MDSVFAHSFLDVLGDYGDVLGIIALTTLMGFAIYSVIRSGD